MTKLILICGDRGNGKTLLLTRFMLKSHTPFYTNYKIYQDTQHEKFHRNYNELHVEELMHLDTTPKKVGITEAYEFFESRLGMGSFQRYMSYIVFQSRKRGIDFIIDTQLEDTIDHRFTKLCDYVIVAELQNDGFMYYCTNKKFIRTFFISFKMAERFWGLYDSWEVVMTPQLEQLGKQIEVTNKSKLKERLAELEKAFYETYGIEIEKRKITHAMVDNFLLELDESDVYGSFLYARLQKPTPSKLQP